MEAGNTCLGLGCLGCRGMPWDAVGRSGGRGALGPPSVVEGMGPGSKWRRALGTQCSGSHGRKSGTVGQWESIPLQGVLLPLKH